MFDNKNHYGSISRLLHWGMALLLLWQFATALSHELLEDTALGDFMWSAHKPTGFILLLLIVVRTVWALLNLSRRPPSLNWAARLGHIALYVLMLVVPTLGLLRQYGSGRAFEPFGIPLFGGFEKEIEWLVAPGNLLHGSLAWTLLALIVGHIVMAFWHRKKSGDTDVIPRMWR